MPLWKSAREYAVTIPDHEHEFPEVGEGARCVLCQQPLDGAAKDRFTRFNTYMTDTTERDAITAERAYAHALNALRELDFATQETTVSLTSLQSHDEPTALAVQGRLSKLEDRRDKGLARFTTAGPAVTPLVASTLGTKLDELASLTTKAEATDVEGFKSALLTTQKARDTLDAAQSLSKAAADLRARARISSVWA